MTWPAAASSAVVTLALTLADYGQIAGLVALAITFLAVGRVRNKDATIKTWRENAEAEEARADRLEGELEGVQKRADREHERRIEIQEKAAKLEGQLEELRPYGDAFKALSSRVERTESVLGTAMQEMSELVMQSTAVSSQSVKALEQVTADLQAVEGTLGEIRTDFGRMAERLGAGGDRPIGSV